MKKLVLFTFFYLYCQFSAAQGSQLFFDNLKNSTSSKFICEKRLDFELANFQKSNIEFVSQLAKFCFSNQFYEKDFSSGRLSKGHNQAQALILNLIKYPQPNSYKIVSDTLDTIVKKTAPSVLDSFFIGIIPTVKKTLETYEIIPNEVDQSNQVEESVFSILRSMNSVFLFDYSLTLLDELISFLKKHKHINMLSRAQHIKSLSQLMVGKFSEAQNSLKEALANVREAKEDSSREILIILEIIDLLLGQNKVPEVKKYFDIIDKESNKKNLEEYKSWYYMEVARYNFLNKDTMNAFKYIKLSKDIYQKMNSLDIIFPVLISSEINRSLNKCKESSKILADAQKLYAESLTSCGRNFHFYYEYQLVAFCNKDEVQFNYANSKFTKCIESSHLKDRYLSLIDPLKFLMTSEKNSLNKSEVDNLLKRKNKLFGPHPKSTEIDELVKKF